MAGNSGIISLRFNQDQACLTCAMESGVKIYNVQPLIEKVHFGDIGSIAIAEMLWRTNIIAVVAGGTRPVYADNAVLIYDNTSKKFLFEITCTSSIKAVRFRKDRIIVALQKEIHVFSFPQPVRRLYSINTRDNPKGLMEVATLGTATKQILAFPGHKLGSVQLVDLATIESGISSAPAIINAHESGIACLAVSDDGMKVATASVRGTLIRVFDTTRKTLLVELRRGSDPATLYCITFSRNSEFLCMSSDKGTVHIFAVKDHHMNKQLMLSKTGGLFGKYFESLWALASFTVPPECACVCAFGPKNSVIAACIDGTFHTYRFTLEGNCNRESFDVFLEITGEEDNDT